MTGGFIFWMAMFILAISCSHMFLAFLCVLMALFCSEF